MLSTSRDFVGQQRLAAESENEPAELEAPKTPLLSADVFTNGDVDTLDIETAEKEKEEGLEEDVAHQVRDSEIMEPSLVPNQEDFVEPSLVPTQAEKKEEPKTAAAAVLDGAFAFRLISPRPWSTGIGVGLGDEESSSMHSNSNNSRPKQDQPKSQSMMGAASLERIAKKSTSVSSGLQQVQNQPSTSGAGPPPLYPTSSIADASALKLVDPALAAALSSISPSTLKTLTTRASSPSIREPIIERILEEARFRGGSLDQKSKRSDCCRDQSPIDLTSVRMGHKLANPAESKPKGMSHLSRLRELGWCFLPPLFDIEGELKCNSHGARESTGSTPKTIQTIRRKRRNQLQPNEPMDAEGPDVGNPHASVFSHGFHQKNPLRHISRKQSSPQSMSSPTKLPPILSTIKLKGPVEGEGGAIMRAVGGGTVVYMTSNITKSGRRRKRMGYQMGFASTTVTTSDKGMWGHKDPGFRLLAPDGSAGLELGPLVALGWLKGLGSTDGARFGSGPRRGCHGNWEGVDGWRY
ncbi:hypothetical protein HDU97_007460 [Phlyctochytrium planicorne]|nr:hypothetical protein HDU97_007460 [Phlyctochytrium planicorne]